MQLNAGQSLKIVTDYGFLGDETTIACSYPTLAKTVKVGSTIFFADGSLTSTVTELGEVSKISISNIFVGPCHCEM